MALHLRPIELDKVHGFAAKGHTPNQIQGRISNNRLLAAS